MEYTNFDIVDALEKARPPDGLFNQYSRACKLDFISAEGAELRRERLMQHLSCQPRVIILCGDADISAQLTGIHMTSEEQITDGYVPRVCTEQITSTPKVNADWRSNLIWDELEQFKIADRSIIWAAQPFYTGQSLRSHKRNLPLEINYGLKFLDMLLSQYDYNVPILSYGPIADTALSLMGIEPAAKLGYLKNQVSGRNAVRSAFSYFINQPKHNQTRDSAKHVRDFFASCRTPSPADPAEHKIE